MRWQEQLERFGPARFPYRGLQPGSAIRDTQENRMQRQLALTGYEIGDAAKFRIDSAGLRAVCLADGTWVQSPAICLWYWCDPWWFWPDAVNYRVGDVADSRSYTLLADGSVDVSESFGAAKMTIGYNYKATGEDLRVTVTVKNRNTKTLNWVGFGGLGLSAALGIEYRLCVPAWDGWYTGPAGPDESTCPGYWLRLRCGVVTATDIDTGRPYGVGVHTEGLPICRTLWTYPHSCLYHNAEVDLGPGSTLVFSYGMRFSRNPDRDHLLGMYYHSHEKTKRYYRRDGRPSFVFMRAGPEAITPDNPYGYHSPNFRFDQPEGASAWGVMMADAIQRAGADAAHCWTVGWAAKQGEWGYAVNAQAIPQPILDQLPNLQTPIEEVGGHVTLLTRIAYLTVQGSWENVRYKDVDNSSFVRSEWFARWDRLEDLALGGGYMDDKQRIPTVQILHAYAHQVGSVPTWYAEEFNECLYGVAAAYAQVSGDAADPYWYIYGEQLDVMMKAQPGLPVLLNNTSGLETRAFIDYAAANGCKATVHDHAVWVDPSLADYMRQAYTGKLVAAVSIHGTEWLPVGSVTVPPAG